ncbi:hypothetical protein RSOLAG1IB_10086 [Rhizoctonia solani AG-1 IB]|uniref:Jacalin-type lectin domain-containing protein n=1 Tax=Thanatephorus cucumeris (strain AG1-IB / isolate 7/3/14) TaxID=1108050 RepID=A0A0B7FZ24_THACB|nr:hypothetical protein RSOLAG1IB_10086 [Rhizoctonia solani AG-1 IB]
MNTDCRAPTVDDPCDNNVVLPSGFAHCPGRNDIDQILHGSGWLCGFRVDDMDGPQATARQVASYMEGGAPVIQETNSTLTEFITTHNLRAANYVHHGWSVGAIETISPWTLSRIDATNRHNEKGEWITRRTLAQRLRVQVLLEDLSPAPEFEAAIKDALQRPSSYEKFRAVYDAMNRWGDVIPLGIEIGSSLTLTDREVSFNEVGHFPETNVYNSITHLSTIKTARINRNGATSNAGWEDGRWIIMDVPAVEWRLIRIVAVASTLSLLVSNIQTQLTNLYNERLTYVPPLAIEPITWPRKTYDDVTHASRTISKIAIHSGNHIAALSVTYLDSMTWGGGGDGGIEQTFVLAAGEYITEVLTSTDGEWLRAIQFITNQGRCSGIYGMLEGIPTISRSEGGVLAGLTINTNKHDNFGYMVTGFSGIWRHDIIPRAPKEKDAYSEYFGGNVQPGNGFNDRSIIGNSDSMCISSVEIRAHGDIHSIEFTYTDTRNGKICKVKTPRHGGSHGPYYRFDLEKGEHIVSVTGKHSNEFLRQLCFGTNLGRMSQVYGAGDGQSFSTRAPLGEDRKSLRLQYVLGKCSHGLIGLVFAWTPGLP